MWNLRRAEEFNAMGCFALAAVGFLQIHPQAGFQHLERFLRRRHFKTHLVADIPHLPGAATAEAISGGLQVPNGYQAPGRLMWEVRFLTAADAAVLQHKVRRLSSPSDNLEALQVSGLNVRRLMSPFPLRTITLLSSNTGLLECRETTESHLIATADDGYHQKQNEMMVA